MDSPVLRNLAAMAIAGGLFLVAGCQNDNPVSTSQDLTYAQGSSKANVLLQVRDGRSMVALSNAEVEILGLESAVSDSTGKVEFKDVPVGSYLISVGRSEYEPIVSEFELSLDDGSAEIPVARQSADFILLSKRGITVKGNVFFRPDDDTRSYAENATVELFLSTSSASSRRFITPLRTTNTGPDGSFVFDGLPENTAYSISVRPLAINGEVYSYSSSRTVSGSAAPDTVRPAAFTLAKTEDSYFYVLKENSSTLASNQAYQLTFSEPVNTSELTYDSIGVFQGNSEVLINTSWSSDRKVLLIEPFSGVWEDGVSYRLKIGDLRSTSGAVLHNYEYQSKQFYVHNGGALGDVSNLRYQISHSDDTTRADYNTSNLYLYWSPLANAARYEIFRRRDSDSTWISIGSTGGKLDTTENAYVTDQLEDGGTVKFLVLAANSEARSPIASAEVLTVTDETSPTADYTTSESGFNRSSYGSADTIRVRVYGSYYSNRPFSEPMDTTKMPTFEVREGGNSSYYGDETYKLSADACEWEWDTPSSGYINVAVPANKNAAYDTIMVDFSNVTDIAGNPTDTTGGSGFVVLRTR